MDRQRYILVVGIDFGTSFSKVIIQEQNTREARVVTSRGEWLIPSVVGLHDGCLYGPMCCRIDGAIPYLKILARELLREGGEVACPAHLRQLMDAVGSRPAIEGLLAWYFGNIISAARHYVSESSPWSGFGDGDAEDFITFQLCVPAGYHSDLTAREMYLRALRLGYRLAPLLGGGMDHRADVDEVLEFCKEVDGDLDCEELRDGCYTYPEVAAAVQTVMRAPTARDGLYLTVDVGAGTVDMNAFCRYTAQGVLNPTEQQEDTNSLHYHATSVAFLGASRIAERRRTNPFAGYPVFQENDEGEWGLAPMPEDQLMTKLRGELTSLFHRAKVLQPNRGNMPPGRRTWDECRIYAWGGGFRYYSRYQDVVLEQLDQFMYPPREIDSLPHPPDLMLPRGADFGRLAVAYGLSFHRFRLEDVSLPKDLEGWIERRRNPRNQEQDRRLPRDYFTNPRYNNVDW